MTDPDVWDPPTHDWEALASIREPFPDENVGKLPRVNCWGCNEASKQRRGATCDKHQKRKCQTCHAYISEGHIHLDFVGHAELTDRLLELDLLWNWEPLAFDEQGFPLITQRGNNWVTWIRLTFGGVTRLGVGTCGTNKFEPEKELIGDAMRNAAMRFGAALDLWAKSDLHANQNPDTEPEVQPAPAPVSMQEIFAVFETLPQNVCDKIDDRIRVRYGKHHEEVVGLYSIEDGMLPADEVAALFDYVKRQQFLPDAVEYGDGTVTVEGDQQQLVVDQSGEPFDLEEDVE